MTEMRTRLRQEMMIAFQRWFETGGVDFWSESNAPEFLSDIGAGIAAAAIEGVIACKDYHAHWHKVARAEQRSDVDERQSWMGCAQVDATMEGPKLRGWNRSALDRRWRECIEGQVREGGGE